MKRYIKSSTMDLTDIIHRAVDNIFSNKDRYRSDEDLCNAIYSKIANELSGYQFLDRDKSEVIESIYNKELTRLGILDV